MAILTSSIDYIWWLSLFRKQCTNEWQTWINTTNRTVYKASASSAYAHTTLLVKFKQLIYTNVKLILLCIIMKCILYSYLAAAQRVRRGNKIKCVWNHGFGCVCAAWLIHRICAIYALYTQCWVDIWWCWCLFWMPFDDECFCWYNSAM